MTREGENAFDRGTAGVIGDAGPRVESPLGYHVPAVYNGDISLEAIFSIHLSQPDKDDK
jgi:hypothetical protein